MKLNKRLLTLSEMVVEPYDVVWDCCCDHGLLGFKILADGLVKQVNFVDVVPDIIQSLNEKLNTFSHHLPYHVQWEVFCQDVGQLQLQNVSADSNTANQLVIISGVGGELMIEMLTNLMMRYSGRNIDFLLCPVQHTYKLRGVLSKLNFKLKREQLVVENNRGYELMLVNQIGECNISHAGDDLWQPTIHHKQYLSKLIKHYQRSVGAAGVDRFLYQSALDDYQLVYNQYYVSL